MRAYRCVGAFECVGKCRSYGAQSAFICVYPGFHIGLRPHCTLGFAGVSPLQGLLSYWAFVVLCSLNVFGCVNGLLHSFVYLYVIVWGVVWCSLNVLGCVNWGCCVRSCFCMGCGVVFVKCVWMCKWVVAFVRVFCICLIVFVWGVVLVGLLVRSGNKPQRGDTPA